MSVVRSERTKLSAAYLNTIAGGLFTAGVVAPLAAATFGVAGAGGHISALTLAVGVTIFLVCSAGVHALARLVLKGLQP